VLGLRGSAVAVLAYEVMAEDDEGGNFRPWVPTTVVACIRRSATADGPASRVVNNVSLKHGKKLPEAAGKHRPITFSNRYIGAR
jgi:hypothetical protein